MLFECRHDESQDFIAFIQTAELAGVRNLGAEDLQELFARPHGLGFRAESVDENESRYPEIAGSKSDGACFCFCRVAIDFSMGVLAEEAEVQFRNENFL
jgi:hypothetical protein